MVNKRKSSRPTIQARFPVTNEVTLLSSQFGIKAFKTLPLPRGELAAAFNGSLTIACGGHDEKGFLTADTFLITKEGKIRTAQSLPQPRARHTMAATSDGTVLVVGGIIEEQTGALSLAKDVLSYDSKKDRWKAIAELPNRVAQATAEFIGGELYVFAGDTGVQTEPGFPIAPARCRSDVQILKLKTGRWRAGASKPTPETGVTSARRGSEVFVCSSYEDHGNIQAIVEVYDVDGDKWRHIPDMPTARTGVPTGFVDGKLYCVNGKGAKLEMLSVVEIYDPMTNKWSSQKSGPPRCCSAGYAEVDDGLLIIGGRN
jgi:N-acetylneuraminic acid mutarotase